MNQNLGLVYYCTYFGIQGPRNSIGPDIQHFMLGSEGMLFVHFCPTMFRIVVKALKINIFGFKTTTILMCLNSKARGAMGQCQFPMCPILYLTHCTHVPTKICRGLSVIAMLHFPSQLPHWLQLAIPDTMTLDFQQYILAVQHLSFLSPMLPLCEANYPLDQMPTASSGLNSQCKPE